jgi:branched-chain amino acid transport system substrate-binding protein
MSIRALRKLSGLGSIGLVLLIGGSDARAAEPGITPDKIKIGMFGPLTGPVSLWGYPINNGAIAVYNHVNATGGIHGRKIEVVDEDDGCDPAKAVAAVKKLIVKEDVFAIHGGTCSATVMAAKDDILEAKMPYVVMAATLDKISSPVSKYIYTTTMPGSGDGSVMAGFVASMPQVKTVAIVKHSDEWADAKAGAFSAALDKKIKVVATEQIDRKVADAVSQAVRIKQLNPDVVIAFTYPAETAVLLRDARKYGLTVPFVATTSVMDLADLSQRAGGVDVMKQVYAASFLASPPGSSASAKWDEIYKANFPNDKLQTLSFFGMSGALLVVDALRRAGPDLTREKFIQALETTKDLDAGPAYCKISITPENHQGCTQGTVWSFVDGKVVPVGPTWIEPKQ